MKTSVAIVMGIAGLALGSGLPLVASATLESTKLAIIQTTIPQVPYSVGERLPSHGRAEVAIAVDHLGNLNDLLVLSYTDKRFADAAVAALKQWKYRPATIDGQAADVLTNVAFDFDITGQVYSLSHTDTADAFVQSMIDEFVVRRVCPASKLDAAPRAVHVVSPVPIRPAEAGDRSVTVQFYIDETGTPRLAAVNPGADPLLAAASLNAIAQWRFDRPMRHGEPVVARAAQRFEFPAAAQAR